MSESTPSFVVQVLITVGALIALVGFVWWQMRRDGRDFSPFRVLVVTSAAALGSLPFVAVFWWFSLRSREVEQLLLLAAVFVPISVLEAYGFVYGLRKLREKSHEAKKG